MSAIISILISDEKGINCGKLVDGNKTILSEFG
jgi:hypothetical protein